jgi:nucleotide-binding universal stress UspA family protein
MLVDAKTAPEESHSLGGKLGDEGILAPLLADDPTVVRDQIRVATGLARARDAVLVAVDPASSTGWTRADHRRSDSDADECELLDWAVETVSEGTGGLWPGRGNFQGMLEAVVTYDVDTVVVPGEDSVLGSSVSQRIAAHADCDVVLVNGRPGLDDLASVLLPIAGGVHSGLATDVAGAVATASDAWVDVLHVVPPEGTGRRRRKAERYVTAAAERLGTDEDRVDTWLLEDENPATAIVEQSQYYGLTVLGAPSSNRLERFVFGSTGDEVRSAAESPVVMAKNNRVPSGLDI